MSPIFHFDRFDIKSQLVSVPVGSFVLPAPVIILTALQPLDCMPVTAPRNRICYNGVAISFGGIVPDSTKPFDQTQGKPASATPLNPRRRGIIVGASDGLGAALARKLSRDGYSLALLARSKGKLDALCHEINSKGGNARSYVHNVTDYDVVPSLLRKIVADLGGLDAVIYVASINQPPGGIDKYNFATDRHMVEVNLIGAMAWLTPIAEMFQAAKTGQIVGISSVAGDRGRVGNPGYNTSKAGLTTYLEALRNRLTRHGVNVLTVKPGFMKTEMLKAASGPTPFAIEPVVAANHIVSAMQKRKQVIYTAPIWRWIMLAIQHTPSFIFRRLSF
jgi:short-subunit dehydrogenase